MNKSELIESVAQSADITKVAAGRCLDAFIGAVTKTLVEGGEVSLVGFGAFTVAKRRARVGRNPQTGKTLKIPAKKQPVFKAGKTLKNTVN
ncbi:HU family DNA-binding protein [Pseudomonas carassii]|uniref:HU family DNA-binding protein n=1 Tax=Pseudomonas carassii TaxID=3115855 RepID=A0ABU7HIR8_9PSED|nr:HU family DNA-binding protein [Pseudomonas sp. 137P]MEE1891097.1 HU family DNA-binding protein [Pseudomonas sp. 137P]